MRWLWSCIFGLSAIAVFGQCPVADFNMASTACLNEQLTLENKSFNSLFSEWFICNTDYAVAPAARKIVSNFGAVYDSKYVRVGQDDYLFFVSQTQNKLVGLKFTDLRNLEYNVHCEIDLSSIITNPAAIDIIYEDGTWVGLISSIVSPFKLVKVVFGQNFQSLTASEDLTSLVTLATPFSVKLLSDQDNYFAFVTNSTGTVGQQVIRLAFGPSLSNVPAVTYIGFPAPSQAASIEFNKTCDEWTALVSSRNGKLFRVDFGADLGILTPVVTELTLSEPLNDPGGLAMMSDHDEVVLVIQSRNGITYSAKMSSYTDNTVDITSFGNIKSIVRDWGVEAIPYEGGQKIITANFNSGGVGGLYALDFVQLCPATIQYSQRQSEMISFNQPGVIKVTLKATNAEGDSHSFTREVLVSNLEAPDIVIVHPPAYCVSSPVSFEFTSATPIAGQTWMFGDGAGTSTNPFPDYSYGDSGNFSVILSATASNGCSNIQESEIVIYDMPSSDFILSPTLLCTNNSFLFPTTTPDIYNGNLSYQWFVDNSPVSTERDLEYTFTTTGPKEIKLKTSIPGCSDEITKTTSAVQPGPVVDFSFTGTCEDEMFSFQNETSDAVESLTWDFGNGQTSTEIHPSTHFTEYGDFTVSLTATNTIGCENVNTKTLSVRAVPTVDFTVNGPPNACSGVNALLRNATVNPDGAAITEWLWDPGDGSAPVSQTTPDAQHVFANGGAYTVSLTAITEHGCVGTVDKMIVIDQAPATTFTHTPACDDIPVSFTGPGGDDISSLYWEIGTSYYDGPQPTHTFRSPGNYPVYLEVSGWNGCVATRESIIHVPEPLAPDFSVLRNCVGDETILTDITDGVEPVLSSQWEFSNGNVFTSSPLLHTFHSPGSEDVTLQVTTASGCVYAVTKPVQVLPQPVAAFSADPDNGAWPLIVSFSNTSSNATQYFWEFADGTGSTSGETSPVYTFLSTGTFPVKLTASNAQQCESNVIVNIPVIAPLPDADIALLTLSANADGSLKLIATIHNKGNTVIRDLPMDIDLSGKLSLRHIVDGPILPGAKYNAVLGTDILNPQDLQYVCASIDLQDDLNPALNKACEELTAQLFIFPAYPNPVSGDLNLEWISRGQHLLTIRLTDAMGRNVYSAEVDGIEGFNHRVLDLSGIRNGVYVLSIKEGGSTRSQRITILGKP